MKLLYQLFRYLKSNPGLIFILTFSLLIRLAFIKDGIIPFQFDHGKDSLAVMDMIVNHNLKFIGPWTSIPGLRFGPAWYYLLAPVYLLSSGDPMSAVYLMVGLLLLQTALMYRFFGWQAALITSTSATWIALSRSAWNPFPMTLVSLLLLIILQGIAFRKKLLTSDAFFLGFLSSLGFHFSTAYAIFFVPILAVVLWWRKVLPSIKQTVVIAIAFLIPFLPQLAFELKHGFPQTTAVIAYIKDPSITQSGLELQPFSLSKILSVTVLYISELKLYVLSDFVTSNQTLNSILGLSVVLAFAFGVGRAIRHSQLKLGPEIVAFLGLPLVGFWLLHFNVWYVLGAAPIVVVAAGIGMQQLPKKIQYLIAALLLFGACSQLYFFESSDKYKLATEPNFLPTRVATMAYIREKAGSKPFAVYHYIPAIYDFGYQYLYFRQAWTGQPLPVDFSYKPNESIYVPEKPALLATFFSKQTNLSAELLFFVVEAPQQSVLLDRWWSEQRSHEVIDTHQISPAVTIYVATPSELE